MSRRRTSGEGSVYRRGDRWAGSIELDAEASGGRRRRFVYGSTQREVLDKLDELRRKLDLGLQIATGRGMTVGEYLTSWARDTLALQVESGDIRASTADSYRDLVARHLVPGLGRNRLEELKPPQVRAFLAAKRKETSARGRPLSPRTVTYMHAVLRRALADAVRDELVSRNVALLVSPGKAPRPRVVPVTDIEARALLAAAADDRLRVLWLVLLSLGLRRGEALALRWSAVDLDGGTLEVRASLQRRRTNEVTPSGRRRSTLVEVDPKTEGSVRTLALPDVLVEALRQQRRVQTAERLAARTWVDAGLVFTTSVGTALEPRNVSRSWERVCKRAGLDRHLRIHDLRHAAASFLLLQGADLRTVMEQLGHSRLATTSDVYVHVLDQVKRDAASRMDGFLRTIAGP